MTKKQQQRERLEQVRERLSAARGERAKAREQVAAAEKVKDADAVALAEAKLGRAEDEVEYLGNLERAALSHVAFGSVDRFGGTLANNLDAQRALAEIAESSAPLRANVAIGSFMGIDDVVAMTGRALNAAPVDAPDRGGRTGWLGIAPTPVPPTSLLDLFLSVPMEGWTADLMRRSGVVEAAIQPHGTTKAEGALSYVADSVRALTAAAWVKANRQDLDDIEGLTADIAVALQYGRPRQGRGHPA